MKLCGESRPRNKVQNKNGCLLGLGGICAISEAVGQFIDVLSQARRRAATQMELLYASSGDLSCESPTGDFPSPLPALLERQEGLSDPQSQGLGQSQDREQTVSPSPLAPRPVTMSVFKATTPSEVLCGAFGVIFKKKFFFCYCLQVWGQDADRV